MNIVRRLGNLFRLDRPGKNYTPLKLDADMFGLWEVLGEHIVEASKNYNDATLGWMMGVGQYQQIRLDAHHFVQLVSADAGSIADRTRGGGSNLLYRISVQWYWGNRGGGRAIYTSPMLYYVLASDFDRWWTIKLARDGEGTGPIVPRVEPGMKIS